MKRRSASSTSAFSRLRKCRHCRRRRLCRSRGLCWRCFHNPTIRPLYSPGNNSGVEDRNGGYGLPPRTRSEAGTPGKLEALEQRARAGLALWHPQDGMPDSEDAPRECC